MSAPALKSSPDRTQACRRSDSGNIADVGCGDALQKETPGGYLDLFREELRGEIQMVTNS